MLSEIPTKIKVTVILLVCAIVGLLGYGLYNQMSKSNKIAVTISSAPTDAAITVDGQRIGSNPVYLEPNKTYKFTASKDGFETQSTTKYITSADSVVPFELPGVSDEAKQWAKDNQDIYLEVEGSAGQSAIKKGEAFTAKNPVTDSLPLETLIYTIGYKADQTDPSGNSIIVTVDAAPGYRNGALQAIKDLGYDPTQFKIEFKDYTNPFSS